MLLARLPVALVQEILRGCDVFALRSGAAAPCGAVAIMRLVTDCLLCRWPDADREFGRVEVWRNELWRLTTSLAAPVLGFSYLEPIRHIPHITDLDGEEAATVGATLARVTAVLKVEAAADLVYVNVFGERVAHLHFNIAPHRNGDALVGGPGMLRNDAAPLPQSEMRAVADRVRDCMTR